MKRPVKPEERTLWQTAMRGVKRMVAHAEMLPVPEVVLQSKETPQAAVLPVSAVKKPSRRDAALPGALDSETARRLKTGKIAIEGRLDLHGLDEKAAYARLVAFIADAVRDGKKLILVITGKGRFGSGTLRRNLPLWLEAPALHPHVAALQPAALRDGGEGAFYIRLR